MEGCACHLKEEFSSLELSSYLGRRDNLILWHLPSIALIYDLFTFKGLDTLKVNISYDLSKSWASSVTWPLLDVWLYFWEILLKD